MNDFSRIQIRTADVAAAGRFYGQILPGRALEIVPLPAPLVARGVPAHWLGFVRVDDLPRAIDSFSQHGATALGPVRDDGAGGRAVVVRGPGQEIVGLVTGGRAEPPDIAGASLYADGAERAKQAYAACFGWSFGAIQDLGPLGRHQDFAYRAGAAGFGTVIDLRELVGVHPHWLFHVAVADLAETVGRVRAAGGVVVGPTRLPGGDVVAMCEDPQRGAFALRQAGPPAP